MAAIILLRHSWQQSHKKGLYYGFRDAILSHLVTMHHAWCSMRYTVYPGLVSCPFLCNPYNYTLSKLFNFSFTCLLKFFTAFSSDSYRMLQVNEKFHKLERGYRDCIKRTRDKTRIYGILHDAPGA